MRAIRCIFFALLLIFPSMSQANEVSSVSLIEKDASVKATQFYHKYQEGLEEAKCLGKELIFVFLSEGDDQERVVYWYEVASSLYNFFKDVATIVVMLPENNESLSEVMKNIKDFKSLFPEVAFPPSCLVSIELLENGEASVVDILSLEDS
ncbi:hypothetical protein cpL1_0099 [Chlamydia pecorum]|uniref:Uncharacterized protein n=1 Tax=Chlamydia pecorum TaxID=85991 RepID=A0AA40U5B0_9CHLA|nr:hypothetical protein [Chlamydia pecorum]KTF28888.1 hypothetical protein cpL1_0099 [Chlamydia pecorum]KZN27294.1 hypothetical protein cpL17_0225 [Chlamydia pecorum]